MTITIDGLLFEVDGLAQTVEVSGTRGLAFRLPLPALRAFVARLEPAPVPAPEGEGTPRAVLPLAVRLAAIHYGEAENAHGASGEDHDGKLAEDCRRAWDALESAIGAALRSPAPPSPDLAERVRRRTLAEVEALLEEAWRSGRGGGAAWVEFTRTFHRMLRSAPPAEEPATPRPDPTHRCKACGALWTMNPPSAVQPEGSWSLWSKRCGTCCDNVPMGEQIEPITEYRRHERLSEPEQAEVEMRSAASQPAESREIEAAVKRFGSLLNLARFGLAAPVPGVNTFVSRPAEREEERPRAGGLPGRDGRCVMCGQPIEMHAPTDQPRCVYRAPAPAHPAESESGGARGTCRSTQHVGVDEDFPHPKMSACVDWRPASPSETEPEEGAKP